MINTIAQTDTTSDKRQMKDHKRKRDERQRSKEMVKPLTRILHYRFLFL